ncbi:Mannosyltransferase related to Gpi18 [Ruminococcaceae bacterium KH2T8]|nr:Mannosyltransferase related to Gpi18 [Ruminococcaceae bacterium KH2T8]
MSEKILDPKKEKIEYIVFSAAIIGLSLFVRAFGFNFISADYNLFLKPWYEEIASLGGFRALNTQVGNYSVLYQMFIAFFTYLNINPLYCYKALSVAFDFLLTVGVFKLLSDFKPAVDPYKIFFHSCFACLMLPAVFLNSSYWGQCDAIYVAFIVWALYLFRKERYTAAFVMLGLSFSFKLQVVFILPFAVYYCWFRKKIEITKLAIIPLVGFIISLPAVFMGRPWYEFINIYTSQSDYYKFMTFNAPNVWEVYQTNYDKMKFPALLITFAVLGVGLLFVIMRKIRLDDPEIFMALAAWSTWTCVMFLPAMHERYFFIVDIMMLILVLVAPKRYIVFFLAEETISFVVTYLFTLFWVEIDLVAWSWANVILYVAFTVAVTINVIKKNSEEEQVVPA